MRTGLRWMLSAVLAVACLAVVGCESDNADTEDRDKAARRRERLERRRDRELGRDRDRDRDRDRPDQVIGRRSDPLDRDSTRARRGMDEIPTTASRVDEGSGPRLTYAPARDGTLYVYDADADRVIYSGAVRADDRFSMDPADNRATVNGRTVLGADLNANHRYRLYFDRGRK